MPWLLSTGGYGVLIANLTESLFRLGSERRGVWSVEADARTLSLRVFAGRPAALVRQLTRVTGRQPAPAAPWLLGPWFQTGHANVEPGELEHARTLRRGDAPVSAVETHMRYMPCGADQGQEVPERARTRAFHRLGLAALTYLREAVCRAIRRRSTAAPRSACSYAAPAAPLHLRVVRRRRRDAGRNDRLRQPARRRLLRVAAPPRDPERL